MEKPNQTPENNCGVGQGSLPGCCASLVFPYIPMQEPNPVRFSRMEALQTGTLFPGLDLPFKAAIQAKTKKMYGPLLQTDLTPEDGYAWLKDPWPWDEGGND